MEIRINKEIREYTENMFFGLSMRQFIFSIVACGAAVGIYFAFRGFFGIETLSWMCILAALPFALIGFVKYHGMMAEQFIIAWFKSVFLIPKRLTFRSYNLYYDVLKESYETKEKEVLKKHD